MPRRDRHGRGSMFTPERSQRGARGPCLGWASDAHMPGQCDEEAEQPQGAQLGSPASPAIHPGSTVTRGHRANACCICEQRDRRAGCWGPRRRGAPLHPNAAAAVAPAAGLVSSAVFFLPHVQGSPTLICSQQTCKRNRSLEGLSGRRPSARARAIQHASEGAGGWGRSRAADKVTGRTRQWVPSRPAWRTRAARVRARQGAAVGSWPLRVWVWGRRQKKSGKAGAGQRVIGGEGERTARPVAERGWWSATNTRAPPPASAPGEGGAAKHMWLGSARAPDAGARAARRSTPNRKRANQGLRLSDPQS